MVERAAVTLKARPSAAPSEEAELSSMGAAVFQEKIVERAAEIVAQRLMQG